MKQDRLNELNDKLDSGKITHEERIERTGLILEEDYRLVDSGPEMRDLLYYIQEQLIHINSDVKMDNELAHHNRVILSQIKLTLDKIEGK